MQSANSVISASLKRILLAAYIDYLLFSVFWEIVWHFIGPAEGPFLLKFLFFTMFELLSFWRIGSPGQYFLSIYSSEQEWRMSQFRYNPASSGLLVQPEIFNNESWLTILLGILFILDGSKECVRWTMWAPATPYFGLGPDFVTSTIISVIFGVVYIYIGCLILKLKKSGFITGIGTLIIYIVSIVLSWKYWDDFVTRYVMQRRAFQNLPVRDGEIEMMKMVMPEGVIIFSIIILFVLLLVRKKLSR